MLAPLADWLRGGTAAVAGSLSPVGKSFSANFSLGHALTYRKVTGIVKKIPEPSSVSILPPPSSSPHRYVSCAV